MPNIPRFNNVNPAAQNNPVQNNNILEYIRQENPEQQNTVQNRDVNEDTYTQSPAAQRMRELTDRRQILQEELNALQQEQNPNEREREQVNNIREEIEGINRETETLTAPEQNNTGNRIIEAMEQYQEQRQTVLRNQNTTGTNNMGLYG